MPTSILPVPITKFTTLYKYCYTTGPFLLPANPGMPHFMLLNNDTTQQKLGLGFYSCTPAQKVKTAMAFYEPTIKPGEIIDYMPPWGAGTIYEVQVLCNSQLILPYICIGTGPGSYTPIAGSVIGPGSFVRLMP